MRGSELGWKKAVVKLEGGLKCGYERCFQCFVNEGERRVHHGAEHVLDPYNSGVRILKVNEDHFQGVLFVG